MDFPTTIGGTIYVKDSDELAILSIAGLPPGTTVFNEDVGAFFKLTVSARTDIDVAAGDDYDDDTWTIADADFTGLEGCTLQVSLDQPNQGFSGNFVIDSVTSATIVVVTPALGTATVGDIVGSAVVFTDALDTDVVVSAAGVVGLRWVIVTGAAEITSSAPVSGDGTVGDPVTIADGALAMAKLADVDTLTVFGRVDASTGVPKALTATELTTIPNVATTSLKGAMSATDKVKLDGLPGPWTIVGPTVGDVADFTLATGLNGDTDGGYEIKGYLATLAGTENISLRPNNADTDCYYAVITAAPATAAGGGAVGLRLTSGGTGDEPVFRCWLDGARTIAGTAVTRMFRAVGAEETDPAGYHTAGGMTGSTNITSLVIHGSSADSIKAGSIFMWRKLNEVAS